MALALYWGASAPWEVLGAQFLGGLFFVLFLMRRGWIMPIFRLPRQIYATLVPLIWVDLATVVYFRSDMLLFKFADVANADVGAYGVAFHLIEAFLLLASPVGLLLFRRFRQNEVVMEREAVFALGLDRVYAWTATAAAFFNVAGNLLLMPAYGVWAAAWMTVATEMVLATGLLLALLGPWRNFRNSELA